MRFDITHHDGGDVTFTFLTERGGCDVDVWADGDVYVSTYIFDGRPADVRRSSFPACFAVVRDALGMH